MDETATITSLRYQLSAAQSNFTVQAFADGLLSNFGHNPVVGIRNFVGEAQFAPDTFADASLRLKISASSLVVLDNFKEKDRMEIERAMHADVLETERFPQIIFESTNIVITRIMEGRYKAKIIGDLTLHGTTRKGLWILARVNLDSDALRAQGDFVLNQKDYGIKLVSVAAGGLKLKDEIKFEFDLVGHKE